MTVTTSGNVVDQRIEKVLPLVRPGELPLDDLARTVLAGGRAA